MKQSKLEAKYALPLEGARVADWQLKFGVRLSVDTVP